LNIFNIVSHLFVDILLYLNKRVKLNEEYREVLNFKNIKLLKPKGPTSTISSHPFKFSQKNLTPGGIRNVKHPCWVLALYSIGFTNHIRHNLFDYLC